MHKEDGMTRRSSMLLSPNPVSSDSSAMSSCALSWPTLDDPGDENTAEMSVKTRVIQYQFPFYPSWFRDIFWSAPELRSRRFFFLDFFCFCCSTSLKNFSSCNVVACSLLFLCAYLEVVYKLVVFKFIVHIEVLICAIFQHFRLNN